MAWTSTPRRRRRHTPLPLAFAIVPQLGRPSLYIDDAKLSNTVRHKIEEVAEVREPGDFVRDLKELGGRKRTVRLDQATAADALSRIIAEAGGKPTRGLDPIALMKLKNRSR